MEKRTETQACTLSGTRSDLAGIKSMIFLAAFGLPLIFVSGCGSKLPTVEGTVTLDGEPVADARVVFESPDRATAVAKTDEHGHYDVMTASQRGLAEGSYKVAISAYQTRSGGTESPIPVLKTPKKYNSAATSGLVVDVKKGRNIDVNFDLQKMDD